MDPAERERRQSDALPPLGSYVRYERNNPDGAKDSYLSHRPNQGPPLITPTSPNAKYASPFPTPPLAKSFNSDYFSPPKSRRTSEREEEPQSASSVQSRSVNLPSLPSLGQMIDSIPSNYVPTGIVSTGNMGLSSTSGLSLSTVPRAYNSRLAPENDSDSQAQTSQNHSIPPPLPSAYQLSPANTTASLAVQEKGLSSASTRERYESRSYPHMESSGAPSSYNYPDRQSQKGSPRIQPRQPDGQFSRPPPPPPVHYNSGSEHSATFEHRPYGQISPHISAFPPPPTHTNASSLFPSNSGQSFPGQAAAFYAYQQRNPPYEGDPAGQPDPPYSPKGKSASKPSFQDTYGSAINKALDISELRRELDLIRDNASHLYHFSTQYTPQGGQQGGFSSLKYSGQIEPSKQALDDAIGITHRILEALEYWRTKVVNDQNRKQEQQVNPVKAPLKRPIDYVDDDGSVFGDDMKGGMHLDSKKPRKGKAAPPGRCHSCNRAETPEWRRGPDGARTLCNACGLHYAKLTRKLNKNNSSMGTSPLARKPTSSTLI